jgi:molybdate transport system substrate-binding protein
MSKNTFLHALPGGRKLAQRFQRPPKSVRKPKHGRSPFLQPGFFLILVLALTACGGNSLAFWGPGSIEGQSSTNPIVEKGGLIIQASPTLQPVLQAMQDAFFRTYNRALPIAFDFSNSKILVNNANTAADVDLLITTNQQAMRNAYASGITRSSGTLLATDVLIVVLPPTNPGQISTLQDLARPGLRYLGISASSGLNSHIVAALEKMNLDPAFGAAYSARVFGNIVQNYADGLAAARAIASPAPPGDFAIVYHANYVEVQRQQGPDALRTLALPAQFNSPIPTLATLTRQTKNAPLAQQLLDFMHSPQVAPIWQQFGFTPAV